MSVADNVIYLKLINGDQIIGEVINKTPTSITINNPLLLDEIDDPETGSPQAVLSRYVPFANIKTSTFDQNHVVVQSLIELEMIKYYYLSVKLAKISDNRVKRSIASVNSMIEDSLSANSHDNKQLEIDNPSFFDYIYKGPKTVQ